MSRCHGLSTAQIQDAFAEVIAAAGGTISETFDDGHRLLTRSILPMVREVRARDPVQGGVALRASEEEVWVHPYVFRQVCRNGAIMAHTLQSQHFALTAMTTDEALTAVRNAVHDCCAAEAFAESADRMRASIDVEADLVLNLLPLLNRLPADSGDLLNNILHRFQGDSIRSRFALGNAITAEARDTREPELRWRLEEFGGGVLAGVDPQPDSGNGRAALREVAEPAVA